MTADKVDLNTILHAAECLANRVHTTPVLRSRILNEMTGLSLHFKCEQFQKVGAFKMRGASYAIANLTAEQRKRGVVTHSSGNHAQALALAAREAAIDAHIVMPSNSPAVKKAAVIDYGAKVYECEPTLLAREQRANELVDALGATLIPPYNHPHVIAGQGTVGIELHNQVERLDTVLVPVGGGGLASGVSIALKSLKPSIKIYGVEPSGADDAARSLKSGTLIPQTNPRTIADGLRTSLGSLTFPILREHLDGIITVEEDSIIKSMKLIWSRLKTVVEPSAAVCLAAILDHPNMLGDAKEVGLILSGGNVDLDQLPWSNP